MTIIEEMAEAIYTTHLREPRDDEKNPPIAWANASSEVKEWTKAQARSALDVITKKLHY